MVLRPPPLTKCSMSPGVLETYAWSEPPATEPKRLSQAGYDAPKRVLAQHRAVWTNKMNASLHHFTGTMRRVTATVR